MAILKRPMFRKGGSANSGIMDGLDRGHYANGGTIGGGMIHGNPMGYRTGFQDPTWEGTPSEWEEIAKMYGMGGTLSTDYTDPANIEKWSQPSTDFDFFKWAVKDKVAEKAEKIEQEETLAAAKSVAAAGKIPGRGDEGMMGTGEWFAAQKDDGGINGISGADAKAIIADKKSALSDRAKEFAELLSPGAQKRAIYDALGAASAAFGESTGDTKQDIANAISAAAAGMGGATDTYQKARLLAIEEDIKKTIAEAGKADYKPNATQSLITYLEDSGMTKEEVAAHLTSKSADKELDYIRAYTTTPEAIGAYVSKVESKDIENFGGVLSNNPKERKDELKTLPEGQIYFDSAKNEYVTITKDAEGDREFKFLKKR